MTEHVDMNLPPETSSPRRDSAGERYSAITTGLLMVGGGIGLMLHRQQVIDARELWRWAPLLMLLPGGRALVTAQGPGRGSLAALAWVAGTGLALLASHGYPVLRGETLFALGLVAGGAWLLWRPEAQRRRR